MVLKLTVPGVPDIYQGNEIWDFSLVDPDNRRPVDYGLRRRSLESLDGVRPEELLRHWSDGRIKLFLTQKLLRFRRDHAELFKEGRYLPLAANGTFAGCVVAFAREHNGEWIIVIAPRLSSRVGFPPIGEKWQDTMLELPEPLSRGAVRDIFGGREVSVSAGRLQLSEALAQLPFAVCTNVTVS